MTNIDLAIVTTTCKSQDQIDLARRQSHFFGLAYEFTNVFHKHHALLINWEPTVSKEVAAELLDVDVHDSASRQVKSHIV